MKKKVVVITECRRFRMNYGETLQAVALNRAISKLGYHCFTASYENQKADLRGWLLKNIKEYGIRAVQYELFRIRYMSHTIMRSNNKDDFRELLSKADAVVCGSDVIWYEKDYNSIFFLNFPQYNISKIAYAPSLRDSIVDDICYRTKVKRWINDIDYLSTREKAGSKIIQDLSGRDVETVLDPTLLFRKNEWNKMCAGRVVRQPYIFLYVIGKSVILENILMQVRASFPGRKVVWVKMEGNDGYPVGEALSNIGPAEFISLVRYADVVITDSFHGTAFSVIYRKQFFAVKRIVDENDIYDNDCRLKNILDLLKLKNYYTTEDKINFADSKINYQNVERYLNGERKKSWDYLKMALM